MTSPKYSFSIDYDVKLENGLRSKAGGWGRGLQTLAQILGEVGHSIDVYTIEPETIKFKYKNVRFLDYFKGPVKEYDVVLWNGWSYDQPSKVGKLYFYLEFFRNWERRPLQYSFLSKNNCYIGFPFQEEDVLFLDKSSEFRDKSLLFPFPIIYKFTDTYNYNKNIWVNSQKPYQYPHSFKDNYIEATNIIKELCQKKNKVFGLFPTGEEPLDNVFTCLKETQLLFPFSPSGSTLEAVASGVVGLPIFKSEPHVQTFLPFGRSSIKAGTYLEYPIDMKRLVDVVELVLSSEQQYQSIVDILRQELIPNQHQNAIQYIETLIGQLI